MSVISINTHDGAHKIYDSDTLGGKTKVCEVTITDNININEKVKMTKAYKRVKSGKNILMCATSQNL